MQESRAGGAAFGGRGTGAAQLMERTFGMVSCREFGRFGACRKAKRFLRLPPVRLCDNTQLDAVAIARTKRHSAKYD